MRSLTFCICTTLFLSLFFAQPLASENKFDSKVLFSKGAWSVKLTHDSSDGSLWCSGQAKNRNGQTFVIAVYENSQMSLFIFDDTWNISPRKVRFLIDIDYARWTMDGRGDGFSVSLAMNDAEKSAKFLTELMQGNAVAVMNSEERRLAVFSLSGSYAAITNLFDCWESIAQSSTDPFLSQSDPFN